jgi:uncharacterized protein with ParB-like and HNH nuclease domain
METIVTVDKAMALQDEITNERSRLSSDRMDISFSELMNLYQSKELIIRPEYQRLYRWTSKQKTALIESILLGIPIPPIFVSEDENGIWELVDGLQRVATFVSFFGYLTDNVTNLSAQYDEEEGEEENIKLENEWTLEEGSLLKKLEGFNINTLPSKLKVNLKRAVLRVEILRGESGIEMKYELFKRLNSGGSSLKPQEIRNAIYRGTNPQLNNLIAELSQDTTFRKLTGLSKQRKRELYDQELVLKFIAFLNNAENINDNTERYLDAFMENTVRDEAFDYNYYKNTFKDVLGVIDTLENPNVFRTSKGLFVPSEFEGITIGIAQNMDYYKNNTELLANKIDELKADITFKQSSGSASNSKNRIKNRLKRANEIFSTLPNL